LINKNRAVTDTNGLKPRKDKIMENKGMTQRVFLMRVKELVTDKEVLEKADELLASLDKKNAARSSKPSKTQIENEPIKVSILEFLAGGKVQTAPEIAVAVGISTQKASALAKQLVEVGKVVQSEIKVPKKGKMKAYSLATEEVADVE
jgi:hypothetical protein